MPLLIYNRALLRGMLAGAVALAGASACSRDRADAGRDTTQVGRTGTAVTPSDTQASATIAAPATDTAAAPARDTAVATATPTPAPAESPSATEAQDTAAPAAEQDVSGYQAMGHVGEADTSVAVATDTSVTDTAAMTTDTSVAVAIDTMAGDTVAITSDTTSAEMANAAADTAATAEADTMAQDHAMADTTAAGYEPMARDTSTVLAQGDTAAPVYTDTTVQAEADTAAIQVQADTTTGAQTELAVEDQADTVTVVGDTSSIDKPGPRAKEDTVSRKADSLAQYHEPDRVRPTEDSTEILGNVTTDRAEANAEVDADADANVEAVGDANAEAVGAAQVQPTGNIATGEDAVALMTREGQRCTVVDPEESPEVSWDMASSPATLNPCGTGTMTLPRIWTGEKD